MNGIVKIYFSRRGYGFIDGDDGESYYFHLMNTNLDRKRIYSLDGLKVEFSPYKSVIDNVTRNEAREVYFQIDEVKMDQVKVNFSEVSELLKGKVITDFRRESVMVQGPFRQYVMKVKDPETGKETEVSFSAL